MSFSCPTSTCSAISIWPGSRQRASSPTSAAAQSASSRLPTLFALVRVLGAKPDLRGAEGLGRLVAQLHTLRRMSLSVNGMLQAGKEPVLEGSIVKDLGTVWEQALPGKARELAAFVDARQADREAFDALLRYATTIAPKLTIQGGTTEVLRGIIARGLGLR